MNKVHSLVKVERGKFTECTHFGHIVISDDSGQIVKAWGNPEEIILPRSSVKMIQALPLLLSGAADAYGLSSQELALSCASHQGSAQHTVAVLSWLENLGLSDLDLRCGPQLPNDRLSHAALIKKDRSPCQIHNNCSGKHSGFLTLTKHLGAGPEYIEPDHPVQKAALEMFEMTTRSTSPGYGIDGCSAPNFAGQLDHIARSMAWFASSEDRSDSASIAAKRLIDAMRIHPLLVAGEQRACTELMQAMDGRVAVKTGAEGVFVAIIPEKKFGIALKIIDGASRASACVLATLLVELGVLNRNHPIAQKYLRLPILNRRGVQTGCIRASEDLHL